MYRFVKICYILYLQCKELKKLKQLMDNQLYHWKEEARDWKCKLKATFKIICI